LEEDRAIDPVILEHALLDVKPGQGAAFEAALAKALPLISATPGFLGIEVRPCIEVANRYLLLVQWESVEAHEKGFRGSSRYTEWRALLHHFYDPFPHVTHFGPAVAQA
jgi:heme-degrading monooxygenase HmoA